MSGGVQCRVSSVECRVVECVFGFRFQFRIWCFASVGLLAVGQLQGASYRTVHTSRKFQTKERAENDITSRSMQCFR